VKVPVSWVDAFSKGPFTGNPAAVCVVASPPPDDWMQRLAFEFGIAETAFVVPRQDGAFDLRWFTPTTEVDLCGHATLASAHVLRQDGIVDGSQAVVFHTRSGALPVTYDGASLTLDFPAAARERSEMPEVLAPMFSFTAECWDGADFMVVLEDRHQVEHLEPDLSAIRSLTNRGLVVCAPDEEYDFVVRFFAPAFGIDEDPATGSIQCLLAPYWTQQLGRNPLRSLQLSPRRGYLSAEVSGERVLISGEAVTVVRGDVTSA
jgi:PhzF family phenazine biosynthesis protein